MRKHLTMPTLLAMSLVLAGCASQPNPNLEQARLNFSGLQQDPRSLQMAALETKDAEQMLVKADKAYQDKQDQERVDQLAYLANQRVELARQTILLKTAEEDYKAVSDQRSQARLDAREAEIRKLQEKLDAKPSDRGSVITFGDVLFDVNKADLKPAAFGNIRSLAEFLQQHPERQVLIEGFTDNTGSDAYNLDLSQRRADSVRHALVRQGVDMRRISTQGFGKAHPVSDNSTPASRAMNRRVEVTISHDASPVQQRL